MLFIPRTYSGVAGRMEQALRAKPAMAGSGAVYLRGRDSRVRGMGSASGLGASGTGIVGAMGANAGWRRHEDIDTCAPSDLSELKAFARLQNELPEVPLR